MERKYRENIYVAKSIYRQDIASDSVLVFVKYRVKIVISSVIAGVQVIPYCGATLRDLPVHLSLTNIRRGTSAHINISKHTAEKNQTSASAFREGFTEKISKKS